MAIEAAAWRMEQAQRGRAWLAWHIAALTRAKRLPRFQQLVGVHDAKPLEGDELAERRREFEEMTQAWEGR